jgi:hypothetical protein
MPESRTDNVFMEHLLQRVPELASVYAADQALMEGEWLAHCIMGRVSRFAQDAQMAIRRIRGPIRVQLDLTLNKLLAVLEEGMRNGDESVRTVIRDSFLENLGGGEYDQVYAELADRLGRALQDGLDAVNRSWRNPPPGCE